MSKPQDLIFTQTQMTLLEAVLILGAETYDKHAAEFKAGAEQFRAAQAAGEAIPQNGVVNPAAYDGMAQQFTRQAADARKLLDVVRGSDLDQGDDEFMGEIEIIRRATPEAA